MARYWCDASAGDAWFGLGEGIRRANFKATRFFLL